MNPFFSFNHRNGQKTGHPGGRLIATLATLVLVSCGGGNPSSDVAGTAILPTPGISLLAGALGGPGDADSTGDAARFNTPFAVAVDSAGNSYIADTGNNTIRKITPAGVVTTLAGSAGLPGNDNGTGAAARFSSPYGIAVDSSGNVYVSDTGNQTIRKITPGGVVTTLAGSPGTPGIANGNGPAARFISPVGLAVDGSGNVYVTDVSAHTVRKITPGGDVTTLAGTPGTAGSLDGTGAAAGFRGPTGIAVDAAGNLYVADTGNQTIRLVTPSGAVGVVSTIAGSAGNSGATDGPALGGALFSSPVGITLDGSNNLYVADTRNQTLRMISAGGTVSTVAGLTGTGGATDGTGSAARFNLLAGVAMDGAGNIEIADTYNHAIRLVTPAGVVTTVAAKLPDTGSTNATGSAARFNTPGGISTDTTGNLYVADTFNHTIRKVTAAGDVTLLAGAAGTTGSVDGAATDARFQGPRGVATDINGNLYVADTANQVIRKITAGVTSTLAGSAGSPGTVNGTGAVARFSYPGAVAADIDGNVYVADTSNHAIRKITPDGTVTTLAGTAGTSGSVDGTGSAARFNSPAGIATDLDGNIYVADTANQTIRKITPAGVVTTLAGTAGTAGTTDDTGTAALFNNPYGLVVDVDGNVYVADTSSGSVRKITPAGVVTTLAGTPGSNGVVLGGLPGGLNLPRGIAIAPDGSLYASSENAILKITLATPINRFGASLRASSSSIMLGESVSLSWFGADAASCQASGDWSGNVGVAGHTTITPTVAGDTTYTLTCTQSGTGATRSTSVTVTTTTPVPVVTLTAVQQPDKSWLLQWSVSNATSCTSGGDWSVTHPSSSGGSLTLLLAEGAYTYTLSCTGTGGTGYAFVNINVTPPAPTVTLGAAPLIITQGQSTTLNWTSSNTTSCTASGAWSGSKPVNGSAIVTPDAGNKTYNLSCTGNGGTALRSVTVTVQAAPAAGGSGGGAADMDLLLGLGVMALLRRHGTRKTQQGA